MSISNQSPHKTLFAFTLKSHFEQEEMKDVQTYQLPGDQKWLYAQTQEELQNLMDRLDLEAFPEEHRESDGLILLVNAAQNYITTKDNLVKPSLEILRSAIFDSIPVSKRTTHYQVPVDERLNITVSKLTTKQQIKNLAAMFPSVLLIAILIGLFVAIFPFRFNEIGASGGTQYFLENANYVSIFGIVSVFFMGLFFWLVMLSRLEISMTGTDNEIIGVIQNLINLIRHLDPGAAKLRNHYFLIIGLLLVLLSMAGATWWSTAQPLPVVEFEIREPGKDPIVLSEDQVHKITPDSTVEFRITLPPTVSDPSCRWSTSSKNSSIYQQSGCQAVYWSRDIKNEDTIIAEIIENGKHLSTAVLTLQIEEKGE